MDPPPAQGKHISLVTASGLFLKQLITFSILTQQKSKDPSVIHSCASRCVCPRFLPLCCWQLCQVLPGKLWLFSILKWNSSWLFSSVVYVGSCRNIMWILATSTVWSASCPYTRAKNKIKKINYTRLQCVIYSSHYFWKMLLVAGCMRHNLFRNMT